MADAASKNCAPFKSDEARTRYMAAYDVALREWPVAYQELDVPRVNTAFPKEFSKAELGAILTPTLLLIGDNELLYEPHATLRRSRDRMPTLEGEIVPHAHHIAAMAQPERDQRANH